MKVTVTDECISCGACPDACPEVYEMGEDGKAHPKEEVVPEGLEACAREGCEACPVDAIILED